jgi:hypothetical protein
MNIKAKQLLSITPQAETLFTPSATGNCRY